MGFTRTFPDGSVLTSSGLSQNQVQTVIQLLTAQLLGFLISPLNLHITLTSGSTAATVDSASLLYPGVTLTASGLPANTTIISLNGTSLVLSANATTSGVEDAVAQDLNAPKFVRIGWQEQGEPGPSIDIDTVTITAQPLDTEFSRLRDAVYSGNSDIINKVDKFTRTWQIKWMFYGPNSLTNALSVKSPWTTVSYVDSFLSASNLYVNPDVREPGRNPEKFQGQWWERVNMEAEVNELVTETLTVGTVGSIEVGLYTKDGKVADITIID